MPEITIPGWAQQYDKARSPIHPVGVLLHTTEGGGEEYLDSLFITGRRDDGVILSVHFCVFKNGDIHQYAKWEPGTAWYCWHAGESAMPVNLTATVSDRFIGIEIQHKSGEPYPQVQLDALTALLLHIQKAYKKDKWWRNILTEHRIVAPGRKSDPTPPWASVKEAVYRAWEEIKPGEDDVLTDDQAADLIELRHQTAPIQSFVGAITNALLVGDMAEAKRLNDECHQKFPASVTGLPVGWVPGK